MVVSNAVITTLPHYLAIIPWLNIPETTYPYMVFVCTTLSATWHFYEEPMYTPLFYADHLGALVWAVYDLHLMARLPERKREGILMFNMGVFILYALSNALGQYHSAWHIVSALKCILISIIATEN